MHLCTFFYIFPWGGNRTKPCACHLLLPSATTPISMAQQAEPELLLPLHPSGIRDVPGELRHPWPQPSSSKGGAPHPTAARSLMGWAGTRSRAEETRHDNLIGRGLRKGGCFFQDPQTSQLLEDGVPATFPFFSAAFLAKAGAVLRSRGQKTPSGGVPTLYQLMSGLNWKMLPPKAGDFEDLRDFQGFLLAWSNSQKGTDEEGRPPWMSHFCHRGPNPQMPTLHSPCSLVCLPHAVHRFLEAARALTSKIT